MKLIIISRKAFKAPHPAIAFRIRGLQVVCHTYNVGWASYLRARHLDRFGGNWGGHSAVTPGYRFLWVAL